MDIELLLNQLRAVSNDALLEALREYHLVISTVKFTTAFQCIAASHELSLSMSKSSKPPDMPELEHRGGRLRASVVFMVYTTLCYMRSEHLERGLDNVALDSALRPFRDIYRSGSKKEGEDTLVQHIRNSLAHGSFELEKSFEVSFVDREWRETLSVPQLNELCEHVHRLYHEAFTERVPRPAHWSKYGLTAPKPPH
jgi:hypothetical protein